MSNVAKKIIPENFEIFTRAVIGSKRLRNHDFSTKEELGTSFFQPSTMKFKRRIQVPLPPLFEERIERLQSRLFAKSKSEVIQISLGLLFNLIKISNSDGSISVCKQNGAEIPISNLFFLRNSEGFRNKDDKMIKYELTFDENQNNVLEYIQSRMESLSLAETVRFSLRILESLCDYIGEDDLIYANIPGKELIVLELS